MRHPDGSLTDRMSQQQHAATRKRLSDCARLHIYRGKLYEIGSHVLIATLLAKLTELAGSHGSDLPLEQNVHKRFATGHKRLLWLLSRPNVGPSLQWAMMLPRAVSKKASHRAPHLCSGEVRVAAGTSSRHGSIWEPSGYGRLTT